MEVWVEGFFSLFCGGMVCWCHERDEIEGNLIWRKRCAYLSFARNLSVRYPDMYYDLHGETSRLRQSHTKRFLQLRQSSRAGKENVSQIFVRQRALLENCIPASMSKGHLVVAFRRRESIYPVRLGRGKYMNHRFARRSVLHVRPTLNDKICKRSISTTCFSSPMQPIYTCARCRGRGKHA